MAIAGYHAKNIRNVSGLRLGEGRVLGAGVKLNRGGSKLTAVSEALCGPQPRRLGDCITKLSRTPHARLRALQHRCSQILNP